MLIPQQAIVVNADILIDKDKRADLHSCPHLFECLALGRLRKSLVRPYSAPGQVVVYADFADSRIAILRKKDVLVAHDYSFCRDVKVSFRSGC